MLSVPTPHASVPLSTLEETKAFCRNKVKEWESPFRLLLESQSQSAITPIYSSKPDIAMWSTDDRFTFAGDAIHPMAPSGGSGGETAATDIGKLCDVLSESWEMRDGQGHWDSGRLAKKLANYEADMRNRAEKAILYTFETGARIWGGSPDWKTYPEMQST